MKAVIGIISFLTVASSAPAGEMPPWTSDWRLDRYSRIEGNLLIVDVPADARDGAARRTLDLTKFPGGVEHEGPDWNHLVPSADNPRKRTLLNAVKGGATRAE